MRGGRESPRPQPRLGVSCFGPFDIDGGGEGAEEVAGEDGRGCNKD